jgi:hypothetical protein
MKPGLLRMTACCFSVMLLAAGGYLATASAQYEQQGNPTPPYSPQRIDQLLAPIALYPDPLLAHILMASTYPLSVVEAARWVQDPHNVQGASPDVALEQQNWDPSVKSLVSFPQILQMMSNRLDWTQSLGNAFLAQQADVMDSVQRLRAAARASGTLQSSPQETVSTQGQAIMIEPVNPQLVYVPYYNPTVTYGRWSYPDYPPVFFPPPPNYGYVSGPGIFFGVGFGVIGAFWGWDQWDWTHHDIHIDADRYNRVNNYAITHDGRPRYTGNSWQHDPAQRGGFPYGNDVVRQKYQPSSTGAAEMRKNYRGFDDHAVVPAAVVPGLSRQSPANQTPIAMPSSPHAAARVAPAFSSFGKGPDIRAQSQRGQVSRQSMVHVAAPPRAAAPQQRSAPQPSHNAPASNGQRGRRS